MHPRATIEEIKKSFRRLAHLYHPDKNPEDPQLHSFFNELKAAYDVLSSEKSRSAYDLKYFSQFGVNNSSILITPDNLIARVSHIHEAVSIHKRYAIIEDHLMDYLLSLLSDHHISVFRRTASDKQFKDFVEKILSLAHPLHKQQYTLIQNRLRLLTSDRPSYQLLEVALKKRKGHDWYQQYKALIIFLLACLICGLMYLYISRF